MRTYLILKEKAERFNADQDIQSLLAEINADDGALAGITKTYARANADALKAVVFDRPALGARGMKYERLDQWTNEVLLGVR
jgi:xylose isomerase